MTTSFEGFPKQDKLTLVPESFFTELLPQIDDFAELQVTLWALWALQQREGHYRYLRAQDFATSDTLRQFLPQPAALTATLARCVARGSLIEVQVSTGDMLYFMNTERGREACEAIRQGQLILHDHEQVEILPPRPTVYRLYEQEIGLLTPLIAESLQELERDYSADWLREAITLAAEKQAKHLRYIRAVLEGWRKQGKGTHEVAAKSQLTEQLSGRRFTGADSAWIER